MLRQISNTLRRTISSDTPAQSYLSDFKLQDDSLVIESSDPASQPSSLEPSHPSTSQIYPSSLTPSKSTSSDPLSPMSDGMIPTTTSADVLKGKEFAPKKGSKKEGSSLGQKLRKISRQFSGEKKKEKKSRRVSATGKGMKVKPKKVIICLVIVN